MSPYIDYEARYKFRDIKDLAISTPGELNFVLTQACLNFLDGNKTYDLINSVIGALESAKLEFYRRLAAEYEDKKIELNGDVY